MTLTNPLFIIKTGINYKSALDLINQVLYNNSSIYISLYRDEVLHDIYYKCISLFKNKAYNKFVDYIFYDTHSNSNINLENILYIDSRFKKFSHFIYLDSSNIYLPGFFSYIHDLADDIDMYTIKPYQSIDLNLRIDTNSEKQIQVMNRKALEFFCINKQTNLPSSFRHKSIKSNNFIVIENKNISKYNIQESKFRLLYLIEEPNTTLKDSYCFFYEENSKCMNIENNIIGNFTYLNDNQIIINWNFNSSIFSKRYALAENNNYYRAIDVHQTI